MPEFQDFVPRQRFQPSIALSPDASVVAFSSNADGRYDLWVVTVASGQPRRLAGFPDRSVRQIAWTPDGKDLVFTADRDGDEQFRIYQVPLDGGQPEEISRGDDCQRVLGAAPFDESGRFLAYAANDRDPAVQDLLVRDLVDDCERRVIPPADEAFEPAGISPDGRWLLAAGFRSHTEIACYLVDLADPESEPVCVTAAHGPGIFDPAAWAPDSSGFYLLTDNWGEFSAAAFYSLTERTLHPIDQPGWDVDLLDAAGDSLMWSVNEAGQSVLYASRNGSPGLLPEIPRGVITALALATDLAVLLIDTGRRPAEIGVLDFSSGFRYLTDARPPALRVVEPIEPELIKYPTARDREVHALVYRPSGPGPHPVLLSIHGGPEAQERPVYARSGLYQHLVAEGIAIFAPNIAGSTGYGIDYQKLIYRDWGGVDLDDLDHAMRYLAPQPWADQERVATMGGSYGGFAALSCVARLPYPWAAAVSICGPTNLLILAKASPPTWKAFIATVLGDPDTDAELLLQRSPVTYADAITAPLFILQGAHDPRVPKNESDQLVSRLRSRGVHVRYDVYPDEGHGFTVRENELRAYADIAQFLNARLKPS